jgi:methyl-accepting chemotaxis protein
MSHDERKHVWIDPFQTRLAVRIAAYLALFILVLGNFLFAWKLLTEGVRDPLVQLGEMFQTHYPVLVCLLLLAPVMAWDAIRFSHRLLGPLVRFRRTMRQVAEGEAVRPLQLREGDHLTDLRDEFNAMLESLQRRGVPVLQPREPVEPQKAEKTRV